MAKSYSSWSHREARRIDGDPTGGERLTAGHQSCTDSPFDRLIGMNQKSAETRARNKNERESRLALRKF